MQITGQALLKVTPVQKEVIERANRTTALDYCTNPIQKHNLRRDRTKLGPSREPERIFCRGKSTITTNNKSNWASGTLKNFTKLPHTEKKVQIFSLGYGEDEHTYPRKVTHLGPRTCSVGEAKSCTHFTNTTNLYTAFTRHIGYRYTSDSKPWNPTSTKRVPRIAQKGEK